MLITLTSPGPFYYSPRLLLAGLAHTVQWIPRSVSRSQARRYAWSGQGSSRSRGRHRSASTRPLLGWFVRSHRSWLGPRLLEPIALPAVRVVMAGAGQGSSWHGSRGARRTASLLLAGLVRAVHLERAGGPRPQCGCGAGCSCRRRWAPSCAGRRPRRRDLDAGVVCGAGRVVARVGAWIPRSRSGSTLRSTRPHLQRV